MYQSQQDIIHQNGDVMREEGNTDRKDDTMCEEDNKYLKDYITCEDNIHLKENVTGEEPDFVHPNQGDTILIRNAKPSTDYEKDNSKHNMQPQSNKHKNILMYTKKLLIPIIFFVIGFSLAIIFSFLWPNFILNTIQTNKRESKISSGFERFFNLRDINQIPLGYFNNAQELLLKGPVDNNNQGRTDKYSVISVKRSGIYPNSITTINLSDGYQLKINNDYSLLYDCNGNLIYSIELKKVTQEDELESKVLNAAASSRNLRGDDLNSTPRRKLHSRRHYGDNELFGRYPINAPPRSPTSFFDAYCRYGCGGMSVTFPYYYRPFFGYGFPLIGTESLFPAGYGGYPGAPIMAASAAAEDTVTLM